MSLKVHPLLIADHNQMEDKVLHFVPAGETVCQVCRLSKHRMRFHYTDEPSFWAIAQVQDHLGMVNPSTECVEPYVPCRGPDYKPEAFGLNVLMGNFGGTVQ